ncbi:hypothetical protein NXV13_10695 [Bacteroides ovatus]|nr:hypothetical protein [Bacteroides ovatus]
MTMRCPELGADAVSELVPIAHPPILPYYYRDACPVKGHFDSVVRIPDGDTSVIGTSANHQRTVHDYLVRLHGTGVYPISVNGGGIFFRRCQVKDRCIEYIPGQRGGSRSLCPVDIEVMGAGEIRGPADDLVDVLLPVSRTGSGGEPAA